MAIASVLTYLAWNMLKKFGLDMTVEQALSLYTQGADAIIYLAISAFTWWFGDRMTNKYLQSKGDKSVKSKKPEEGAPDVF